MSDLALFFSSELDRQLSWRLKEISGLFTTWKSARSAFRRYIGRSFICMLYSHWEGFGRYTACRYIDCILQTDQPLNQLKPTFYALHLYNEFQGISPQSHVGTYAHIFALLNAVGNDRLNCDPWRLIDTRSNLSSDVLEKIYRTCAVEFDEYWKTKRNFIDFVLLSRRNLIAHGQDTVLDDMDIIEMKDETLEMLSAIRTDFENAIVTRRYLARSA